jgi:DNA-binding CsgD family transcriptional regulator
MHQIMGVWMEQRGNSAILDVGSVGGMLAAAERAPLTSARIDELLVHGVSRPQRPAELESFFIFARAGQRWGDQHRSNLELILPQLHATYLRVLASEREFTRVPTSSAAPRTVDVQGIITNREKQILGWVREGKSNQEIGLQLTISALTVKNHVQKILRKLGAANRAQAVAKAMTLNLLERGAPSSSPFGSSRAEIET